MGMRLLPKYYSAIPVSKYHTIVHMGTMIIHELMIDIVLLRGLRKHSSKGTQYSIYYSDLYLIIVKGRPPVKTISILLHKGI